MSKFAISVVDEKRCRGCGLCQNLMICPAPLDCIGCGACVWGCPHEARRLVEDKEERGLIDIIVDGESVKVPERVTIRKALELVGISWGISPGEGDLQAPCGTGGCFSCEILANGEAVRACVSPVVEGMEIITELPADQPPKRIIHGPQPHGVGGKATPWWLKSGERYIEVAVWAAGCNLRCPQCQNYATTYDGRSQPLTPGEAANKVTKARKAFGVDRMAISGGEPTLNRKWLVRYFKWLKKLNPDPQARLHLDSNGTLLTADYIDELAREAGVTDIGVEPKGVRADTFMRITGISDVGLANRYLATAWGAIEYIWQNYREQVFLGVGLPYNRELMSLHEVDEFGERVAGIDVDLQVCVLDYFPTFRRPNLRRPAVGEMLKVKRVLEGKGLKTVIVQTSMGHIGPG